MQNVTRKDDLRLSRNVAWAHECPSSSPARHTISWKERLHGLDEIQPTEPEAQEEVSSLKRVAVRARTARSPQHQRLIHERGHHYVDPASDAASWRGATLLANLTMLHLRRLFHLSLRQTKGFVPSLLD